MDNGTLHVSRTISGFLQIYLPHRWIGRIELRDNFQRRLEACLLDDGNNFEEFL